MAINQNAESIGSSGYAVRGPISAAVAVGCCLIEVGSNQLGWSASAVSLVGHTHNVADVTDLATALTGLVSKAGDTMTGALNGTSFIASSAIVGQNVLADYYLTTQANLSLRTSGVVKFQNVAGNADVGFTGGAGTLSGNIAIATAGVAGTAASPTLKLGAFATGLFENNASLFVTRQGTTQVAFDGTNVNLKSTVALGWASGSPDATSADISLVRNAAGQLDVRANNGLRIRNLANSAYAFLAANAGVSFSPYGIVRDDGAKTVLEAYGGHQLALKNYSSTVATKVLCNNGFAVRNEADNADAALTTGAATLSGPLYLAPITFATLPSASAQTGARYRITDRSQRECYSDGTNWRFAADDAIVT